MEPEEAADKLMAFAELGAIKLPRAGKGKMGKGGTRGGGDGKRGGEGEASSTWLDPRGKKAAHPSHGLCIRVGHFGECGGSVVWEGEGLLEEAWGEPFVVTADGKRPYLRDMGNVWEVAHLSRRR